jgi:hypothetical protein
MSEHERVLLERTARLRWCGNSFDVLEADAIDAVLAELETLRFNLAQAEDALALARKAAGPHDRPFLDDAVGLLRQRAEAAETHSRNHHIEACETCAACTCERDEALAKLAEAERMVQMMQRIAEDVLSDPVKYDEITPEMVRDAFIKRWNALLADVAEWKRVAYAETKSNACVWQAKCEQAEAKLAESVLSCYEAGCQCQDGLPCERVEPA